jgi:hypothetical protein
LRYINPATGKQVRRSAQTDDRELAKQRAWDWEQELNAEHDPFVDEYPGGSGCVYFIELKTPGFVRLVKIGYTESSVAGRLEICRTMCGNATLLVAIPGTRLKEKRIHKHFDECRLYRADGERPSEVFVLTNKLWNCIKSLQGKHKPWDDSVFDDA